MSAETLRKAARLMRERAEAATGGPWWRSGTSIETVHECSRDHGCHPVGDTYGGLPLSGNEKADATHIAAMDPTVALAVADWLDTVAARLHETGSTGPLDMPAALAVARAYLREES